MSIPDQDAIRKKLTSLGAKEVKKRLEIGAYAANKVPIVEAWLADQAKLEESGRGENPKTLVDRYLERLKNHRAIAILVVTATIVGGVAQFTDAVSKLAVALPGVFRTAVTLPSIPGDSGWLLLGDLDPAGTRYIRGPFYEIVKSSYPGRSLTPQKGELLRLLAERNVIIAGYKGTGFARQLVPPWQLNVLSDADYTGVKLPKGAIVEVRDVGLGSFPGQPIVVWVRVAPPPK